LAHALHQRIEVFRLRMAAAKGWNGGNEIALFVLLNHDSECSFGPHAQPRALTLSQSARLPGMSKPRSLLDLYEREIAYFFSGLRAKE
jgi:hypothetical protein